MSDMYSLIKNIAKNPVMFIQGSYLEANKEMYAGLLAGKNFSSGLVASQGSWMKPYLVTRDGRKIRLGEMLEVLPSIERSSEGYEGVMTINLNEVILKFGAPCAEGGMIQFSQVLERAGKSPAVRGVVIIADSPGGQGDGALLLHEAVKNLAAKKPVYTYVQAGGIYSAAYWGLVPSTGIYASGSTDGFGSIGGYYTIVDFSKHYESVGIKVHQVYAPQSTGKNKAVRDLFDEGKTELLEEDLKQFVDLFIDDVAIARGLDKTGEWAKGYEYTFAKAKEQGLVDGIKTLEEVIDMAFTHKVTGGDGQGNAQGNGNQVFNNKKGRKMSKLLPIMAVMLGYESMTADHDGGVYLNAEEQEKLYGEINKMQGFEKDLATANEVKETQKSRIADLEKEVEALKKEVKDLEEVKLENTKLPTETAGAVNEEKKEEKMHSVTEEAMRMFNHLNPKKID